MSEENVTEGVENTAVNGEAAPVEQTEQVNGTAFVGGEIVIKSDAVTGAISVSAPANAVVAVGLLEIAKEIVLEQNRQRVRTQARPPAIIPAGRDALENLRKLGLKS